MAVTCDNCGFVYNEDHAVRCAVCNGQLPSSSPTACLSSQTIAVPFEEESPQMPASRPAQPVAGFGRQPAEPPLGSSRPAIQDTPQSTPSNVPGIEGRITHIERNDERPPMDVYRFLAQWLIGMLLFIPFAGLFVITGGLSLIFAIIGFRTLSMLFNPFTWSTALFEFLEILVLRRIRGSDTIPVYRGMVEDDGSREVAFIFRGPMRAGNLVAGHNVRLLGRPNRGTFVIRRGMDLTSNSEIISGYRNPWRYIFCFLLTLYIILGFGVYLNLPEIAGYFG